MFDVVRGVEEQRRANSSKVFAFMPQVFPGQLLARVLAKTEALH